ncbi:uridine kinase [Haloarcula sp. S1CR25-12]|uniref:Uridine kinase n=1 Tax=Haloarcula saliterrae TaxID=2950534 RepID=A0ABU2FDY7_9EURY|nr:uridine kinase [Haloarcula sp. S1CR25-12]MDS0260163.1 uridine kinase [Haloarcula sp. S1CR25-12]
MSESPFLIGIAGGTGAGKTTIATEIVDAVDVDMVLLSLDNYYCDQSELSPEERAELNFDHPDAIDWERLIGDVRSLSENEAVAVPQYNLETHTRERDPITVEPEPIVIVEGILALYHDRILDQLDLSIYVQTDPDVRVLRRIRRDIEERDRTVDGVIEQYLSTVKPMHEQFVEPTKRKADIIIPEGVNEPAMELLQEKAMREIGPKAEYQEM